MAQYVTWMKFPPLGKAEYELGRSLCEKYGMVRPDGKPDWHELFTVLLRLGYEATRYRDGEGERWLQNVIDTYRNNRDEQRVYEL